MNILEKVANCLEGNRKCKYWDICKWYREYFHTCNVDPTEYNCEDRFIDSAN